VFGLTPIRGRRKERSSTRRNFLDWLERLTNVATSVRSKHRYFQWIFNGLTFAQGGVMVSAKTGDRRSRPRET